MSYYSDCEGLLSDDVDSDTETYLYSKLHYDWEITGLELRGNEIATTVPNNPPINKNPAKRKKIDDIRPNIRPKSEKIPVKIEKVDDDVQCDSDNDDKFSKYYQTFKTTSVEIKQQNQECIQIVDLSSDSDSDCIVLNDHNSILLADGNVLTTLESTLGAAEDVNNNVNSLKRKRKKSKKKKEKKRKKKKKAEKKMKDLKLFVQESCSKITPNENVQSMMTTESNEILDVFPKKFDNTLSYVEKMKRFYDSDCSLLDDCELERIMKGTNKIKKMITRKSVQGLNGRYFGSVHGVRCDNCRQWDHVFEDCPEPLKKLTCYLCGDIGHYAAGCPKLSCGICFQRGHGSWKCHNALARYKMICTLCKCVGHNSEECPDLWRRYYLTTKPGPLVEGDPRNLRKSSEMYCCNCGRKGHYVFDCTRYKMKPAYHPIWPFVVEYNDPNHHVFSNHSRENSSHTSKDGENHKRWHSDDRNGELIKEAQFLRKGKKSSHRSFKSKKSKKKKYMYKNVNYNMQMRR